MNYLCIEVIRMINDYKKRLLGFGILIGIILFALLSYRDFFPEVEQPQIIEDEPSSLAENESRLAYIRFYIELPEGNPFTNNSVLTYVFNSENLIEELYETTNVDMNELKEKNTKKGIVRGNLIEVRIDNSSSILTAVFETGDNDTNLIVADFYYKYLMGGKLSILNNMTIHSLTEPKLNDVQEVTSETIIIEQENINSPFLLKMLFNIIISISLGLTVVLGVIIIKELFSRRLNYSFAYDNIHEEKFIVFDKKLNNKEKIRFFIGNPYTKEKLVLSEEKLNDFQKNILTDRKEVSFSNLNGNTMYLKEENTLENISLNTDYVEIIIVVQSKLTSRNWYNNQLAISKIYNKPLKVIQINA